jgi:(2S)-methylsuccinyl-CoA dehydrogenase
MLPNADRSGAGLRLLVQTREAALAAEGVLRDAIASVRDRVQANGELADRLLNREQRAVHGLAWLATYVEAIRQIAGYAERLHAGGLLGEVEEHLIHIGLGEYLSQILGGIPMSQGEFVRPGDLGLTMEDVSVRMAGPLTSLTVGCEERRARLVGLMRSSREPTVGDCNLDDTLASIRGEMRNFADTEVAPFANDWHLMNEYIPLKTIAQLAEIGVFGLAIPTEHGGMGLGKEAICVVSEELSRGYIGVGSLGTRADIAAELILRSGTEEQKHRWLPRIASGNVLPTAVFTEPDVGSDLASAKTRAVRRGDTYKVTGSKIWITHAARADLMLLLVRTNPTIEGHPGLSILLAEKPRGTDQTPFPAKGMSGSEIWVLGYRGMKEFEIAFDGFEVPASNLLGGVEGVGFRQLMGTFESSRIQTAARAIGVAQAAMEQALRYAVERHQFGEPIVTFPRISDKIAMMAAEIMMARQLTYFAARQKDTGVRCDLEAGMAKLLAARVAWAAADNAVQIHGGNGFALAFPASRLLCDARILSIFEGAAEIQAQVIARRLLEQGN